MSKFLFILHCLAITLVYSLIRLVHFNFSEISTLQVAGYMNIICLIFMIPFFILKLKDVLSYSKNSLSLTSSVLSSAFKIYAIGHVSPRNTIVMSFLQPFFIILLSFFFLGEYDKKNNKHFLFMLFSFFGAIIFVGGFELKENSFAYFLVLIHIILKAITSIFIKKSVNKQQNQYITLFYLTLYYSLFGFFVIGKDISIKYLLNPYIIILAIVNMISQLAIINSYKLAEKISLLQNLDFSKIVFGVLVTLIIFNEPILLRQIIGSILILFSMLFSNLKAIKEYYRNYYKKINTNQNV